MVEMRGIEPLTSAFPDNPLNQRLFKSCFILLALFVDKFVYQSVTDPDGAVHPFPQSQRHPFNQDRCAYSLITV